MEERFPDEFVTWHHRTFPGIKVDEIFGMDSKNGKTWLELARQIYSEQGQQYYRIIEHFKSGAPFLDGYPGRISISHTSHFLIVASLPKTPELNLEYFNPRSAMGVDAERLDRAQVFKIRSKFLSKKELEFIPEDDLILNILAWTAKEALYKAALTPGLDFKENILLLKLPTLTDNPLKGCEADLGISEIIFPGESEQRHQMKLFSYTSYGCCVTLAYDSKCAKFGK